MYEYLKTTTVFTGRDKKNTNNFISYFTETEHNMVNLKATDYTFCITSVMLYLQVFAIWTKTEVIVSIATIESKQWKLI